MDNKTSALVQSLSKTQLSHAWKVLASGLARRGLVCERVPNDAASLRAAICNVADPSFDQVLRALPADWPRSEPIARALGLSVSELNRLPADAVRQKLVLEIFGIPFGIGGIDVYLAHQWSMTFNLPAGFFKTLLPEPFPTDKHGIGECGINFKEIADCPYECEAAIASFRERDGAGFAASVASGALAFVADNIYQLQTHGMYENALMEAFQSPRTSHYRWQPKAIRTLFEYADRAKLLAAGDPLPGNGPFIIYRGVAGEGEHRRIGGMSWTTSLEVACWFATRLHKVDPAVYEATVKADDVLCFSNKRDELEVIACPTNSRRMLLSQAEIAEHADALTKRRAKECAVEAERLIKEAKS